MLATSFAQRESVELDSSFLRKNWHLIIMEVGDHCCLSVLAGLNILLERDRIFMGELGLTDFDSFVLTKKKSDTTMESERGHFWTSSLVRWLTHGAD